MLPGVCSPGEGRATDGWVWAPAARTLSAGVLRIVDAVRGCYVGFIIEGMGRVESPRPGKDRT